MMSKFKDLANKAGKSLGVLYLGLVLSGFGVVVYVMLPEAITGNAGPWVGDCEDEIKKRLKFPASYARESSSVDDNAKPTSKSDNLTIMFRRRIISIEYTAKSQDNATRRNIATCDLTYKHALPNKTLGIVNGNISFKYQD
jgi:hypothetical protein